MTLQQYVNTTGITKKELAEKAGVPAPCIVRFLKGTRGLSPTTAAALSAATRGRVSVEELLYPNGLPRLAKLQAKNTRTIINNGEKSLPV